MALERYRIGLGIHYADALTSEALCGRRVDRAKRTGDRAPVTCGECKEVAAGARFSFCEPVGAGTVTPIHIRVLSPQGRFMGGAADTPALCGRQVAWDLTGAVDADAVESRRTCPSCRVVWREATALGRGLATSRA